MAKEQRDYRSYLLRLWRAENYGRSTWRVMLEDLHTGERHGFANLEALFSFLKARLVESQIRAEENLSREE